MAKDNDVPRGKRIFVNICLTIFGILIAIAICYAEGVDFGSIDFKDIGDGLMMLSD